MDQSDRDTLEAFANRLRRRFPRAEVRAFGSRARGEGKTDSDLDVCVVLERVNPDVRAEVSDIAWEIGFDRDVVISTVVFSRQQFLHGPCSVSPLVGAIREQGVAA
jgi:predicted nucleotidyltransferase